MLTNEQIEEFKTRLTKERDILKQELSAIGVQSTSNPDNWEPKVPKGDTFDADRNDNADIIEALHENNASMNELEIRLKNVNIALKKIDANAYGVCENDNEPIELDRLNANPAARTCIAHAD